MRAVSHRLSAAGRRLRKLAPRAPRSAAGALALSVGLLAHRAGAQEPRPASERASRLPERPWVHVQDASIPAPGQVVVASGATYASTNASVTRPFASNLVGPGTTIDAGGEVGVVGPLAFQAIGMLGGLGTASGAAAGILTGARVELLREGPLRLALGAGYLRELGGEGGAWTRVHASWQTGRVRLAGVLHGEKVFAPRRDAVDVMVTAGASYRLGRYVRSGIEYVAQDLEGYFEREEAEGGVRHFVGPNASFNLADDRFAISAGPAVGLSYDSPKILARLVASCAF
jgi:hypothetical protein